MQTTEHNTQDSPNFAHI